MRQGQLDSRAYSRGTCSRQEQRGIRGNRGATACVSQHGLVKGRGGSRCEAGPVGADDAASSLSSSSSSLVPTRKLTSHLVGVFLKSSVRLIRDVMACGLWDVGCQP